MNMRFCTPTLFGLEGIVADELRFEGKLEQVKAENGKVYFEGDETTLAWANLHLRCAERVLICMGSFQAKSFDDLFEGTKALAWEQFIPMDGAFPVKGHALTSTLHSIPDCQKIIKKAIVNRLGTKYGVSWFEETGAKYQVQFSIMNDTVELFLDTSGAGLHKRGYRANSNAAPLRETLAAGMIKIARWRGREPLFDPFCGSGTIAIEAAMIGMHRAPGLLRGFSCEKWVIMDHLLFKHAREEAIAMIQTPQGHMVFASDIDAQSIQLSADNAKKANIQTAMHVCVQDARKFDGNRNGMLFANPPYGERMLTLTQAHELYHDFGKTMLLSPMKQYIISSDEEFEIYYGKKADKKRKLYNGMIKCNLNMYFRHAFSQKAVYK